MTAALAALLSPSPALTACAAVILDAPCHVAVEGAPVEASGGTPGAEWTLVDWRDRPSGAGGVFGYDGRASLPPLRTGYWRIVDGSGTLATVAVVSPAESGGDSRRGPSPFYALDCAAGRISPSGSFDCPWNDGDTVPALASLARLAGVGHVRERLRWCEVQPTPDAAPDFSRNIACADFFGDRGVALSSLFHDAPEWAGRLKKLPGDLGALNRFCRESAAAFGGRMECWEVWNEPDIEYAPEPVWDYAAALKAASLGFRGARPGMPVLCGSLCRPPESEYAAVLFANDAVRYCDVFNYHVYAPISRYAGLFAAMRESLRRAGADGLPVWITECGTNIEGPALADSSRKGLKAHSPGQELVVAEFCAKSQILLQMEGVARSYFFVLAAYSARGGEKDWGLLRRDGSAKPAYAAMCAMIAATGDAALAGELRVGSGVRAFLFDRPDGSQTVAFWSESPVDTADSETVVDEADEDFARTLRLDVAQSSGPFRLFDMCGFASSVSRDEDGALSLLATRFPSYVSGLSGLRADIPARRMAANKARTEEPDEDLSVVFRVDLAPGDFESTKTLALAKADEPRLRVSVWNFGAGGRTGVVEAAGARLRGLPAEPFALGPAGSPPVAFDCVLEPATPSERATLVLRGMFGGRPTTRLSMPVLFERRFLASCRTEPLPWKDPSAWQRNDSASEYSVSWDEKEGAIRFDVAWADPRARRWFYPTLPVPRGELDGAQWAVFHVKTAQDKVENDFSDVNFMLSRGEKGTASSDWLPYASPSGSWERRYVNLSASDLGGLSDVDAVRIGANPQGMRLTFWLKNLAVLKPRDISTSNTTNEKGGTND